ncbi:hypothetical protein FRACA_90005 [Frankia canadensis]|uniref:Uncharacterized protein n=1 Tax=Frankia canadensis TaxID=1836972 RepID=A0A2I2L261_9ACTN|nr:hypothetical protein FRACA_90005 [Frankia canadensis]SOU59292.1 hypothetical protein FRACA_90005 [Frankia canadensis]
MHELGRAEPDTMAERPSAAVDAAALEEIGGLDNGGVQDPAMAPGLGRGPSTSAAAGVERPHCDGEGAADGLSSVPAQRRTDQNLRAVTDGVLLQRARRRTPSTGSSTIGRSPPRFSGSA